MSWSSGSAPVVNDYRNILPAVQHSKPAIKGVLIQPKIILTTVRRLMVLTPLSKPIPKTAPTIA